MPPLPPPSLLSRAAHARHLRLSRPQSRAAARRSLATLPDPRTPTGSVIVRPAPQTALDAPAPLVPAPVPGDGPLLERRADRALPKYVPWWSPWARTLPVFVALMTAAALGIFNYQKLSSSVVASVLYALRTSEAARDALGSEIYFRDRVPWVSGTMNQLRGVIDIGFGVKGTAGTGYVRFRCRRPERAGMYHTLEWSLELQDGRKIHLLDANGADPLGGVQHQAAVEGGAAA